jgi:uncharacterized membrane protein
MKAKIFHHIIHKSNWLKIIMIIPLLLGIFFRFANLDLKVYGGDEPSTSLRISGHTPSQLNQSLIGNLVNVEDILRYQYPEGETNLLDTIKASAYNSTHPPLYFLMTRIWVQWFGNSIAVTRSFSAFVSLLIFPSIYWLCRELFASSLVGWMAITLVAVSPFHVLYAQEARMYSLWTVIILLSSVTLLRAIRLKTKVSWGIYAATIVLGMYSYLFTGFVAIGHGIYLFVNEGFRFTKTFIAYLIASFISLFAFLPWLWVMITNFSSFEKATTWSTVAMPLSSLVKSWIYHVTYSFIDFFYIFSLYPDSPFNWKFGKIIIPLILILAVFSIYFLFRNTPKRIWLFVLTLMATTATALILRDLRSGGYLSTEARYFIPSYIGIELAVAYLLAQKIISLNNWEQKLWKIITVMVISGGILSCTISSQTETWWNKGNSYDGFQAVKIINQANQPLLITTSVPLGISHVLAPKVQIMIVKSPNIPKIPKQFSNIFLMEKPSAAWKNELETQHNYKLNVVYKGKKSSLYKLSKKSTP